MTENVWVTLGRAARREDPCRPVTRWGLVLSLSSVSVTELSTALQTEIGTQGSGLIAGRMGLCVTARHLAWHPWDRDRVARSGSLAVGTVVAWAQVTPGRAAFHLPVALASCRSDLVVFQKGRLKSVFKPRKPSTLKRAKPPFAMFGEQKVQGTVLMPRSSSWKITQLLRETKLNTGQAV